MKGNSNNSSNNNNLMMSQCPYAVALSEDEEGSHSLDHPSPTGSNLSKKLLTADLSQCPAFSAAGSTATASSSAANNDNGISSRNCPFKDAKSPEEVQQKLAQMPKSHYIQNQESGFYQVLQHLHQVHEQQRSSSSSAAASGFFNDNNSLLQTCPMKSYATAATITTTTKGGGTKSFAQAMEECSLAAIMARLAADLERDNDDDNDSDFEGDDESPLNSNASLLASEVETIVSTTKDDKKINDSSSSNNKNDEEDGVPTKKRNSLAEALKTGTAVSHQAAEDVHFVKNFIKGNIDRQLYQEMVLGLYHVYVALEDALARHAPSVFPSCHFPKQLERRYSLEEDCEFWHNTRTPSSRTISPATQDYIERIQYLAHHDPLLLLAHSYTRYLGDLSGGKILARVARRALDLDKETGEGLAFYRFDKVGSYKQFKDNYRESLDSLPLTGDQINALVAEANVAFCLNMRLFQELDVMATIPGAKVMSMEQVMEYAHKDNKNGKINGAEEEDKCPFLVNKKKEQQQQQQQSGEIVKKEGARCPWPFIFAHDPWQGVKDWQTWLLVALLIAWFKPYYIVQAVGHVRGHD